MFSRLLFVVFVMFSLCPEFVRAQDGMDDEIQIEAYNPDEDFDPSELPIEAEDPSIDGQTHAGFMRQVRVEVAAKPRYHSLPDVTPRKNFVRCRNAPSKEETQLAMRQLASRFPAGKMEEDTSRDGRRFLRVTGEMRPRTIPKPGSDDDTFEAVASTFLRERCRSLGFKKGDVLIPSGPAQILVDDVMTVTFMRYYRGARVDGQTILVNIKDSTVQAVRLVHHLDLISPEMESGIDQALSRKKALEKLAAYFDEKSIDRSSVQWHELPLQVGEPELTIGLRPTGSLPNPPLVAYVITTPIGIITMDAVTGEIVPTILGPSHS